VMFVISSVLGAKYYPIPYRWGRLGLIFLLMGSMYGISLLLPEMSLWLKIVVHTILIGIYALGAFHIIRRS